jgi:hypothetical protein
MMSGLKNRKWMIGCIAATIVAAGLAITSVALNNQVNELKKESVVQLNAEWYQVYRLSEIVDKNYIKDGFQDPVRYQLFVNQTAHHFALAAKANELTVNMRNLLTLTYDPLFQELSLEDGAKNKEEATKLLTAMNDDIMLISQSIVEMQDKEKEKLLDPKSSEFSKLNDQAKAAYEKYKELVDNYFKTNP